MTKGRGSLRYTRDEQTGRPRWCGRDAPLHDLDHRALLLSPGCGPIDSIRGRPISPSSRARTRATEAGRACDTLYPPLIGVTPYPKSPDLASLADGPRWQHNTPQAARIISLPHGTYFPPRRSCLSGACYNPP